MKNQPEILQNILGIIHGNQRIICTRNNNNRSSAGSLVLSSLLGRKFCSAGRQESAVWSRTLGNCRFPDSRVGALSHRLEGHSVVGAHGIDLESLSLLLLSDEPFLIVPIVNCWLWQRPHWSRSRSHHRGWHWWSLLSTLFSSFYTLQNSENVLCKHLQKKQILD